MHDLQILESGYQPDFVNSYLKNKILFLYMYTESVLPDNEPIYQLHILDIAIILFNNSI